MSSLTGIPTKREQPTANYPIVLLGCSPPNQRTEHRTIGDPIERGIEEVSPGAT